MSHCRASSSKYPISTKKQVMGHLHMMSSPSEALALFSVRDHNVWLWTKVYDAMGKLYTFALIIRMEINAGN